MAARAGTRGERRRLGLPAEQRPTGVCGRPSANTSRGGAASPATPTTWSSSAGPSKAVSLLARVLVDEGSVVAIEDPGYELASRALQAHGAHLLPVKVDAEGLRVEALPQGRGSAWSWSRRRTSSLRRRDVAGATNGVARLRRREQLLGRRGRLRRRVSASTALPSRRCDRSTSATG
jgi:hypothetical protein